MTNRKKKYPFIRDLTVYTIANIIGIIKLKDFSILKDFFQFKKWLMYRNSDKSIISSGTPWIVFSTVPYLQKKLKNGLKIFEYGSGGSTKFWIKYSKELISIEHDSSWYTTMLKSFSKDDLKILNYHLILPETSGNCQVNCQENELLCSSEMTGYEGMSFEKYVHFIDNYQDNYFDLIVVDGRARTACINFSLAKLKRGGLLLVDNAERKRYFRLNPELFSEKGWKVKRFSGHFPYASASVLNRTFIFEKLLQ